MEEMEFKENMTQEEFEKAIQSAQDKVRTEYSNKLKEKQNEDKGIEEKFNELMERNKELEAQNHRMELVNKLTEKGLSAELADVINFGEDVESTLTKLEGIMNKDSNFVPTGHKGNEMTITKEQFSQMGYSERVNLADTNPELYSRLSN